MTSRELQRLRAHQEELAAWYAAHQTPYRTQSMSDLKAMREGYLMAGDRVAVEHLDRLIAARNADARQRHTDLLASLRADAETIRRRATRKTVPATEAAKADIRSILASPHATPTSVAQWISEHHASDSPAYFAALREVASQQVAAAGRIGPDAQRATRFAEGVESAIAAFEPRTFNAQEQERAREAEEVRMSVQYMEQNLKQAETFLQREEAGMSGNRPPDSIHKWPGLPSDNLLAGGSRIPLTIPQEV